MEGAVSSFVKLMHEKRDTRADGWLFMDSFYPTLYIVLSYLSLVYIIVPAYMKNRKPYSMFTFMKFYNIFQVVACAALIWKVYQSGWHQGDVTLGCEPVDYSTKPQAVSLLRCFHYTYFLKMIELSETIMFALRKKDNQISKLHVYHHASTFMLGWIGCRYIGGGMASFPIMLNSFIHVLMYSYFYLSTCGPKWQKRLAPWKPRLTMAQMIQFCILIVHALQALQPNCKVPKSLLLIWIPNVVLIFKMFYDFYQQNYNVKNNRKGSGNAGAMKNGVSKKVEMNNNHHVKTK